METSFGGKLQGVSLDSFLQMAQMESITCTLTVKSEDETGYLYLSQGELVSAKAGNLENLDAAYRIIGWEEAVIEIQDSCEKTENQINQPMMNILMEGLRLKDEAPENHEQELIDPLEFEIAEDFSTEVQIEIPEKPAPNSGLTQNQGPKSSTRPEEEPRFKMTRTWRLILLGLLLFLVTGGAITAYLITSARQDKDRYQSLLTAISAEESPGQKIILLNTYLQSNPDKSYADQARKKIEALSNSIISDAYKKLEKTAEGHIKASDFENAIAAYDLFLKTHPRSQYTQEIKAMKKKCAQSIDSRNFNKLLNRTLSMGPERIEEYKAFVAAYPETGHQKEVLDLIAHMEEEFYVYLERQIIDRKKTEDWQECILLSQQFIDAYPDSKHTDILKRFQKKCQEKIQTSAEFDKLVQQANRHGENWASALTVFSDYLKAYPGTPAREKIESKIKRLKDILEAERRSRAEKEITTRLAASSARFIVSNGSFKDKTTGLTWSLLDSRTEVDKCLAYEAAVAYVDGLKTGGHEDWRLPSPDELSGLLKRKPVFPSESGQWYWTSESIKRYVEQWIIDVEVIMPTEDGGVSRIQKESWECGAVRAVRGKK